MRDLGLTYIQAIHGLQTAIKFAMENDPNYKATEPKHMRVGVDGSKSDMLGLVELLIAKGIFTEKEYIESIRLAINEEVAMRESEYDNMVHFR